MCVFCEEDFEDGVTGAVRDAVLPTHYTFKIESFSALSKGLLEKLESQEFEAAGHRWKLLLYPNGNKKENVNDHISLYLVIVGTGSLCPGWKVDVVFRFFLFDHIRDKYLVLGGRAKRFHQMMTTRGFSQLISLATLNDPSNGYVVDDICVFGAEVFNCETTGKGECLSMIKEPVAYIHTWKIENFSHLNVDNVGRARSTVFVSGGHRWQLKLYPKGFSEAKDISLSIFIFLEDSSALTAGQKVLMKFRLCVRSQTNEECMEHNGTEWFSCYENTKGVSHFMELGALSDTPKGFLLKDTCIIEAEVSVLAVADKFCN